MERFFIDWAIRRLKKMNDVERKHEVLTEAVKHLFNLISADDILHINRETRLWEFMGRPLSEGEVTNLKEEAKVLRSMKLWRVLKMDIRYQLHKKMFEESNITQDVMWGKLLMYLDDIIRARLQKLD